MRHDETGRDRGRRTPQPIGCALCGGASLGAIQVGMLQALSEHDGVPDHVAGTAVGALNGTALARGPNRWPGPPRSGGQRAPDTEPKFPVSGTICPGSSLEYRGILVGGVGVSPLHVTPS